MFNDILELWIAKVGNKLSMDLKEIKISCLIFFYSHELRLEVYVLGNT